MTLKYLSGALLASAMLLAPAYAQTTPPADTAPKAATPANPATQPGKWRASKLIGLNVYNQQNEKLGDISEILVDNAGKIQGVVIGVGGFLGIGRHDVMVSFDKLKFVDEPVRTAAPASSPAGQPGARTTDAPRPDAQQPKDTAARETPRTDATPRTTTTGSTTGQNDMVPDHAVLSATKDELKAMPKFEM